MKIVSGAQTGVDRAALDFAMAHNISAGGWIPAGRRSEDGGVPKRYNFLKETESKSYTVRTKWNVRDSDGTLVLNIGDLTGGTEFTARIAQESGKPLLIIQLDQPLEYMRLSEWIRDYSIEVINIAGPRENPEAPIYDLSLQYLHEWYKCGEKDN